MLTRTLLDRAVGLFSPRAELRRLQHRAAASALVAHYAGASNSWRTENWKAPSSGPTAVSTVSLQTLRNRSRDLSRNDPWARNAIEDLETETIGTGIVPKIKGRTARSGKALQALWKAHFETTLCDADGLNDIYGLQALAFRTIAESGEVLIRRRLRYVEDGLPIPMQLQVLEPDHLDISRDKIDTNGSRIIGGIEFDARGRRVAYWLFPEHPGENLGYIPGQASVRVPAESILHLFRVERPGQVRGIPWGASALITIRDFAEYRDASLVRQKIAACFGVFIYDSESSSPAALAGLSSDPDDPDVVRKPPFERVYPGMIKKLAPGEQIQFANPPAVPEHENYSRTVLRAIAAGYGTTYEAISGDYSMVNFSSARLGWIRHSRRVDAWRWRMVVPRFCIPVWAWALEMADVALKIDIEGAETGWSPPRRDMLDPKTEAIATRTEIRAGLKSASAAIRERGDDPDEVFAELAADRDRMDKLGLILESDARRPSNGQAGDPAAAAANAQAQTDPNAGDGADNPPAENPPE